MYARRRQAELTARELLFKHLTERQRETWLRHGLVYVAGSDRRVYALVDGWRIFSLDGDGEPLVEYHFGIRRIRGRRSRLPRGDRVLAQLVWLWLDAGAVCRLGCRWHPRRVPRALRRGTEYQAFVADLGHAPRPGVPNAIANKRWQIGLTVAALLLAAVAAVVAAVVVVVAMLK